MAGRWNKILPLVLLGRLELVFPTLSNIWLMTFLAFDLEKELEPGARRNPELVGWPLPIALVLGAVVGIGLHIYGVVLNDMLDIRHDRVFRPQRPLASGRVSLRSATALAVLSLLAALLAALLLGDLTTYLCLILAAGVLFYNAMGKYLPGLGILNLGLIAAVTMLLPNPQAGFVWPIWVTTTHLLVCVTVAYQLTGKRPRLRTGDTGLLAAGWIFLSLLLVSWMGFRHALHVPNRPNLWLGPLLAAGMFVILALALLGSQAGSLRARRAVGPTFLRLAQTWLIIYDASWLLSAGLYWQGAVLLGLILVSALAWQMRQTLEHLLAAKPAGYHLNAAS